MLLQSLLRPVLTPLMRGMFDAPIASSAAWSPLSLWPDGILSPGMWMSPRTLTSEWQDYTGTTAVAVPGTVADSSNPVGLALDIRAGATVLADPGNHMLQSTSAARPLMSARVNLLTYTEDFSSGWTKELVTATPTTIVETAATGNHRTGATSSPAIVVGATYSYSVRVKRLVGTRNIDLIGINAPGYFVQPFVLSGAGTVGTPNIYGSTATLTNASIVLGDDGYYTCSLSVSWSAGTNMALMFDLNNGTSSNYTGDGVSSLQFDGIQWKKGAATPYQAVLGDGSTYATDFPIYQKYDGVDDGMATAAFAAGTLTSGMDCMIAVRRDSGAACVAGIYNGIADATKFFGMAESASGSGCVGSGAGTPTVWVDGVQLTGGTAVTRGTLHTALTVGDWHILEFRGLDLSTWTAAGFGLYTSYVFPGARGDIFLYPSTTPTEDKDAARQWLADYYGVTLP